MLYLTHYSDKQLRNILPTMECKLPRWAGLLCTLNILPVLCTFFVVTNPQCIRNMNSI